MLEKYIMTEEAEFMKLQKCHSDSQRKKTHYQNEKAPTLSGKESRQSNGQVLSIFKALERCMVSLSF
jgi:hypothetical protein